MTKTNYFLIAILAILILAILIGAFYLFNSKTITIINKNPSSSGVACTMEARLCPDGSSVGRSGANCEFSACPALKPSGIKGVAMLGPMCPVEKNPPDTKCADRPYKTDLVATSPDGTTTFKQFSSDANGQFSIDLSPGNYIIQSNTNGNIFSHCATQGTIKVEQEKYTNVIIKCDTGIR